MRIILAAVAACLALPAQTQTFNGWMGCGLLGCADPVTEDGSLEKRLATTMMPWPVVRRLRAKQENCIADLL
jgi:hypothetical protein